jgi:hypothetical protein
MDEAIPQRHLQGPGHGLEPGDERGVAMKYPQKEGKHGPIYQVADCLFVQFTEYETWQLVLRRGVERKKKTFGKGEEERQLAIKAAELLATRLRLNLAEQTDTGKTFGMVAKKWYELNAGRWRTGTKERYECIIREHLRPLDKLPLDKVDKAQVKRLLADLLQIRAPKTVEVTHAVISGIFTETLSRQLVHHIGLMAKSILPFEGIGPVSPRLFYINSISVGAILGS